MNFAPLNQVKNTPAFRITAILLTAVILLTSGAIYVWQTTPAPQPLAAQTLAPVAAITPLASVVSAVASSSAITSAPKVIFPAIKKPTTSLAEVPALAITHDTNNTLDGLLSKAYQAYQTGDFSRAQTHYLDVIQLAPQNLDALLGLAVIAQRQGKDTLATHYYQQVFNLEPRNAVAHAGMSALHVNENRESQLKLLLSEQADSPALHFALANHYAAQARWSEAQLAYFNAYQLEPNNAEITLNLAISLEHLGQPKLAAQYYRRALQLDAANRAVFDHTKIEQHAQQLVEKND